MNLHRAVPAAALILALLMGGACSRLPDLSGTRIPEVAFDAYRSAAAAASSVEAGCAVDWEVVAAIGRVESNHGRSGARREIAADGVVSPPIRGLPLNGAGGRMAIADTDGGELDGDLAWDRAMGPLQFIPTTWRLLGRDGNGDGVADPDNIYDAALTAVAHLCLREPGDYTDRAQLRSALVDYNASGTYANEVLGWIDQYRETPLEELILAVPSAPPASSGGG